MADLALHGEDAAAHYLSTETLPSRYRYAIVTLQLPEMADLALHGEDAAALEGPAQPLILFYVPGEPPVTVRQHAHRLDAAAPARVSGLLFRCNRALLWAVLGSFEVQYSSFVGNLARFLRGGAQQTSAALL